MVHVVFSKDALGLVFRIISQDPSNKWSWLEKNPIKRFSTSRKINACMKVAISSDWMKPRMFSKLVNVLVDPMTLERIRKHYKRRKVYF